MTEPVAGLQEEMALAARQIVRAADERGVVMRLLGGLAIREHAGGWTVPGPPRVFADIDLATNSSGKKKANSLFGELGYRGKEPFNSVNPSRLVFYSAGLPFHVDVFVGEFEMCHRIELSKRLTIEPLTVPCAELLLTKLQIVDLNEKDVLDLVTLLVAKELREDDGGINAAQIAQVLAGDWGFWRTVTGNLRRLSELTADIRLDAEARDKLDSQLDALRARIEAEPKSLGWKMRSRIGERRQWYLEPEEIAHERTESEHA
jgi:hypothetical protein